MANSSIIQHMMKVLDRYEAKTLRAGEVEVFLDQYAQALEGVGANLLLLLRERTAQLVKSDLERGNERLPVDIPLVSALEELRSHVRILTGESDPAIVLDRSRVGQ